MGDVIEVLTTATNTVEVEAAGPQGPAGAAGATGAQGPQGVPGTGLEVLTTQGDLLYQGASTGQRLPIGSTGQVLKVSGGIPAWGAESGAVTSVNGATGAVLVAAAQHAAEHEAGEADEIQAMAALVTTDASVEERLDGVYFHDGTTTSGRPNFFRTGTRKNTKLQWNNSTGVWELIKNNVARAQSEANASTRPWNGGTWEDPASPPLITLITVTQLGLEDMTQKLAETGSASTATASQDGLISAADQSKLNGIATGAEVNVNADWNASSGDAQILNKPTSLTPTAHASTHHTGGTDALAPSDIGAQSLFDSSSQTLTADTTLSASRAQRVRLSNFDGVTYNVILPTTGIQVGDVFIFTAGTLVAAQNIRKLLFGSTYTTVAQISSQQSYRIIATGTGSSDWQIEEVYTHNHAASQITSGTLLHERGGLEADVSAYNGLVKIASGSTSAVTVTSAGEALLDDADAAAQRTTLGLGTAAVEDTTAFAASGSITSSGLTTATARILGRTTASTGAIEEIQIGSGLSLSAGELSATGSGVTAVGATLADILSVSGSDLVADDLAADKLYGWDDSESKAIGFVIGSGLSVSGDTLSATASGGSKTYAVFTATDNQPTATAFATLDTRNSAACLDFDDATDESAVFVSIIPEAASLGSGLKIRLHWMATTATSGNVVWDVSLERMTTDLDSDSFDTIASGTAAANGTSGILTVTEITLTTIDSVTAGDGYRLKVTRDANNASDTMTGDAELVVCELRSAA